MTIIKRRITTQTVISDKLTIGSNHPVVIQSMTNTDTNNELATIKQIIELYEAGSEIVRLTVDTVSAGNKIESIKQALISDGLDIPLIGDFHFNGHKILTDTNCGQYLDKYRINPGNVGQGAKHNIQFCTIINQAIKYNKPVRIGVNWGSLDQSLLAKQLDLNNKSKTPLSLEDIMREVMIVSALDSAALAMDCGLAEDKIIISCKVSNVEQLLLVYTKLAKKCHFPLHLGLTEAGMGIKGVVASSIAISSLLNLGIGDTFRISLTPEPNQKRSDEIKVAKDILQTMGLRAFSPQVTACPGCGRTSSNYFLYLAKTIEEYLTTNMSIWKNQYLGVENLKVAVMGCVVNGPGESKLANIGISLPGRDEDPVAPVFIDGKHFITLKGDDIIASFKQIVDNYINQNYTKNI